LESQVDHQRAVEPPVGQLECSIVLIARGDQAPR
jgi:hypothetical protein